MKILVSNFGLIHEGGFGRIFAISSGLTQLENDVTLITTIKGIRNFPYKVFYINNVKIIAFFDFLPTNYIWNGYGIISLFEKLVYSVLHKFDIVYSDTGHRPLSGWPCIINRFIYSSFYISEWWDIFETKIQKTDSFIQKVLKKYENYAEIANRKKADCVVVLSQQMKERAISKGIKEEKIEIIHGGADVDRIKFYENNTHIKSKYGFLKNSIVFGFIGISDYDVDDIEPFLYAIIELKDSPIEWFTTGKGLSKKTIEKYSIDSRLHQLGWINYSESTEILSCADILVLLKKPTIRNIYGWPNKLGDYFAIGRPILITPYGDILEYVKKYPLIFIETKLDVNSIKSSILYCINNFEDIRLLNSKVRFYAENIFSWLERAKKINKFLN